VNVRADGIAVVLGPLLRDVRIVAAALVDVDSGMVLDAWSAADAATGPPDLELIGAQHAEIVRGALQLLRTWPGADGATGSCEVVLGADGGVRHLLRTVPDPLGDRLALAVVVDGPQRVLDRVRRRLETVSVDALTAGPSMTRRPSGGGWSFDTPGPDVPAQPEPAAGLLSPGIGPATARPAQGRGVPPARDGRPVTGPGVPSPRDPYPVGGPYPVGPHRAGPNPVGAAPGRPPYRHDGPVAGRSATGEPAAPGPASAGAVPAMAGLVRPVPLGAAPPLAPAVPAPAVPASAAPALAPAGTAPAQAGTRNDTGRDAASDDGAAAEAGAGIASVVIPAEPAARAARRPVLFSVAGGDTPSRPPARQAPPAAQGATDPADPRAADPADSADPAAAPAVRPLADPPAPTPRPASPPSGPRPPSPPAALPAPAQPRPPHA
jgi:hypothetical protein